jgi:hypothetical protein
MTQNEQYLDLTPTASTSPSVACAITTALEIQDPATSGEWITVTQDNLAEYPFIANLASTGLITYYTLPEHLENDFMKKYLVGDDLVVNARWSHCEDTWEEDDRECVQHPFKFTFSFALGDVCATNLIELDQRTIERHYPIALDGSSSLLEIPRGTVAVSYTRCALETIVEVQDPVTEEWENYENSPYFTTGAVEYIATNSYLSVDMDLNQFIDVQTALDIE